MQIELKLYEDFFKYLDDGYKKEKLKIQVDAGTTLGMLLESLNIPAGSVTMILVNKKHKKTDYELRDGDKVTLFPPVAGG